MNKVKSLLKSLQQSFSWPNFCFQFALLLLAFLPGLKAIWSTGIINFYGLGLAFIFQWLNQELFLLFSFGEKHSLIGQTKALLLIECLCFIVIFLLAFSFGWLALALGILIWLLTHSHMISQQWSPYLAIIIYSGQLLLMNNLLEYLNFSTFLTAFSLSYWLIYLGFLACLTQLITKAKKSLVLWGGLLLIAAFPAAIFFRQDQISLVVGLILLSIVCLISKHYQEKNNPHEN
ncbi:MULTISPECIES: hypothetical protein [Aerococcus]|uniref:Uncharacterized protein n=1 Tax=Aerococcus loyolae TaxID=2976809 RepID=A0ABT4BXX2_9LACT|nr:MULTISPECIES: hypothetical protein [Aerococcus]KAA9220088.1 hypothetical protein F6I39_02330 [Aerococcus loyolae]KAA9266388.1 hypothetical protein F6I19_02345 [Aerococcus loyolae]MCY3025114.1 hypothetical protein [Aerococcus loyolae]MCY3027229.1 hypothetical protein [Aerococcus loyolae]MCY3029205.1 hypothetical protein [Aerococcus loyolae]